MSRATIECLNRGQKSEIIYRASSALYILLLLSLLRHRRRRFGGVAMEVTITIMAGCRCSYFIYFMQFILCGKYITSISELTSRIAAILS